MTAAVLDRPAIASPDSPRALRQSPALSQPPGGFRPRLLPVPDSEPPLGSVHGSDEILPEPIGVRRGVPPLRLLTDAGIAAARAVSPLRREQTAIPAPPHMAHRRWVSSRSGGRVADIARASSSAAHGGLPHRAYSAVGVVTAGNDAERHLAPLPIEPVPLTRQAALDIAVVLARATVEALSGRRPITQLRPYYTGGVFAGLQEFPMLGHRGETHLVSVWVCEPATNIAEVSAAFRCGPRTRALAMQLRARGTQWFVTSLQLG